jgi:outer membrane biosynthesis protein TonB
VVQPNLNPVVKRVPDPKEPTKAEREAAAAAAAAAHAQRAAQVLKSRINSAVSGIAGRLSSSTSVTVPGGTGGASYASYSLFVKSVYQWAWRPPSELTDDSATATARIVIARDGTIVSARIETPSKVPSLDRSVRVALDRVTTIGRPFPEGAKDDQRTFLIDFNLKAKEFTG